MSLNPEVKKLWVDALRSGDYKQGNGKLLLDGKYCCIGVLCDLMIKSGADTEGHVSKRLRPDGPDCWGLPDGPSRIALQDWAGMDVSAHRTQVRIGRYTATLFFHNDQGRTFNKIADAIEEQL